jgi:CHC2 zinc finger
MDEAQPKEYFMPAILDDTLTLDQLKDHGGVLGLYLSRAHFANNGKYEYAAVCPFHSEKTGSCTLSQDGARWLWFCFGCGHGGSIIDFIMERDQVLEGAAIQKLREELGAGPHSLPKFAPRPVVKMYVTRSLADYSAEEETALSSNQAAKDWLLNERGITYETARRLHFGFQQSIPKESRHKNTWDIVDKGWITIPSIRGEDVVLEKYRSLARKVFTRRVGMRSVLFNTQTATASGDLYLVSGDFDAAVLEQAGFHAISLQSDTVVGNDLVNELHTLVGNGRLILAGDNDVAGFKIMSEIQAEVKGSLLLRFPADIKDANDLWLKHNNNLPEFQRQIIELTDKALPAPEAAPVALLAEDDETETSDDVPICPPEIINGGYIGELTRLLTDGTTIPPEFVWLNAAMLLGSMIDGKVGISGHADIHTRFYAINVSVQSRTGKGESWKRTGEEGIGLLSSLLEDHGIHIMDGSLFGSGEFMVGAISEKAKPIQQTDCDGIKIIDFKKRVNIIARFDEMSEVFEKSKSQGSTLGPKLLMMFERNTVSTGSFKNEKHVVSNLHFSLSGDFTRAGFEKVFAGQGARGSGLLSRCTYTLARKRPYISRWPEMDSIQGIKIFKKIKECLDRLSDQVVEKPVEEDPDSCFGDDEPVTVAPRFIVPETDAARVMIDQFLRDMDNEDDTFTPELATHFKRYLILQAVFSDHQVIDERIVKLGVLWTRNQLAIRQALWPEDAGAPTEQFEQKIRKVLAAKGTQSFTKLVDRCHVYRPGSGGMENFLRAIKSLTTAGEIRVMEKTRKGASIYALTRTIQ